MECVCVSLSSSGAGGEGKGFYTLKIEGVYGHPKDVSEWISLLEWEGGA